LDRLFRATLETTPWLAFHVLEQAAHPFVFLVFIQERIDEEVGPGVAGLALAWIPTEGGSG
jgi:hypothetical protein